jgi:hypothetical protein
MNDLMYCIDCGHMVSVEDGALGPVHIMTEYHPNEPAELNWCEGPFAANEPPEIEDIFELCNGHEPIE